MSETGSTTIYVMDKKVYSRWLRKLGEPPKCATCGRELRVGRIVVSKQSYTRGSGKKCYVRLRCLECAQKINLI